MMLDQRLLTEVEQDELAEQIATRPPIDDAERDRYTERLSSDLQVNGLLPELAGVWAKWIIWKAIRVAAGGLDWGDAFPWSFEAVLAPKRRGVDEQIVTFVFDRMLDDLAGSTSGSRARAEVEAKRRIVGHYVYFAERAADDPEALSMAFSRDVAFRAVLDVVYVYADHPGWIEAWRP